MNVCMIVRNPFTHDARVSREAAALIDDGHRVTIVAVRTDASQPLRETSGGAEVQRVVIGVGAQQRIRRAVDGVRRIGRRSRHGTGGATALSTGERQPGTTLTGRLANAVWAVRFTLVAARRAVATRPDVYHCHDFNALPAGFLAARRWKAPIVYDSHELYAHLNVAHPTRIRRLLVEALERRLIRRVAATITVSDGIAEWLSARYGIARPAVIRNVPRTPVDDGPRPEPPEALISDGVKALYLGGVTRGRGIEQALDALRDVPDMTVVAMGTPRGNHPDRFRALAVERGVSDRFFILPAVPPEQVIALASHATLGLATIPNVCLSYYLSLPNKLFEYLHAGLPVVASNFPEMSRVVDEYDVGRTCDPSDPAAIARAVREVTADPAAYERMRGNARRAAAEFTWERESQKLIGLYRNLPRAPQGSSA